MTGSGTVVAVHGWLGSAADWNFLAPALGGWRVVPWELPGHGARVEHPVTDFSTTAEELAYFVQQQPGPRVMLGYSMGARVVLAAAVARPHSCEALVLESVRVGLADESARDARRRQDAARAARLREVGTGAFLREWYAQPLFQSLAERPYVLEARIAARRDHPAEAWARALECLGPAEQPDFTGALETLPQPSLWIAGQRDTPFAEVARHAARACPRGVLELVEGAGHDVHAEGPTFFARRVADFLDPLV